MKNKLKRFWYTIQRFFTRRYKTKKALREIGLLVATEYGNNRQFKRRIDKMGLGFKIEHIMARSLK